MTWRRRLRVASLAGSLMLTATGCPIAGEPPVEPRPSTSSPSGPGLPGLPTDASTDLPAYAGPPVDAPPSAGPLLTVRAAVDLTAVTPGVFARTQAAVGAPDGGAYAVVSPVDTDLPPQLATVGGPATGYAVTASVPTPRVVDVWGMHLLADGTVAVVGQLATADAGYAVVVVDPVSGAVRTTRIAPYDEGTTRADGRSALLPGSSTLYVFLTVETGGEARDRLAAVDVLAGRLLVVRELAGDVAAASRRPAGRQLGGLVARPNGGVTLAFDASPTAVTAARVPTLLTYDAALAPVGDPVLVTSVSEGAEIQAVAAGWNGTVFLLVEVQDGTWVLAVPDAAGAGPVLVQLTDRIYDYALVVEPAEVWALLPAAEGARALDLTTGEIRGPVRLGCTPRLDVRAYLPAAGGAGALLVGECDTPREDTQLLWILGP